MTCESVACRSYFTNKSFRAVCARSLISVCNVCTCVYESSEASAYSFGLATNPNPTRARKYFGTRGFGSGSRPLVWTPTRWQSQNSHVSTATGSRRVRKVKQVFIIMTVISWYTNQGIVLRKITIGWICAHSQSIWDVAEFVSSSDLEKCSIACSPKDPLQWMGAVKMRVQTAD